VRNEELFDGNADAANIFNLLCELSHIWDDIVDKDKEVPEALINRAFLIALVELPNSPLYRHIQGALLPMWITVVSCYETANKFERDKEEHGIEISHTLRYAAGNMIAYMVHVVFGQEKARELMPAIWKAVVYERFDDYKKEHLNENA
jgi:hypothetical protein